MSGSWPEYHASHICASMPLTKTSSTRQSCWRHEQIKAAWGHCGHMSDAGAQGKKGGDGRTFFISLKMTGEATLRTKLTRKAGTKGSLGFKWPITIPLVRGVPSAQTQAATSPAVCVPSFAGIYILYIFIFLYFLGFEVQGLNPKPCKILG